MKTLFITVLIAIILIDYNPIEEIRVNLVSSEIKTSLKCNNGQCQAIAKSTKKQCKSCVSKKGDSYCSRHK